jgi:CopG family nickel-responsive transcriptional regulator
MQRFTISLDDQLAAQFDQWITRRGYENRSEAVRDLFRAELERTHQDGEAGLHCVACLSYVFNHHERDLAERIIGLQHAHHDLTVSAMHAHLDHDFCLETVLLKGELKAVRQFADAICAERGVHHGKINLITVEIDARHLHAGPPGGHRYTRKHVTAVPGSGHVHIKPTT